MKDDLPPISERPAVYSPFFTYLIGFAIFILIDFSIPIILKNYLKINLDVISFVGLSGICFSVIIYAGSVQIPEAHIGMPVFFGTRIRSWVLSEGYAWMPLRPIFKLEYWPIGEKTLTLPHLDAMSAPIGKKSRGVVMRIKMALQWKIDNPYNFSTQGGPTAVNFLTTFGLKSAQNLVASYSAQTWMESNIEFGEVIKKTLCVSSNRWGIEIVGTAVERILPRDERIVKAIEQATVESMKEISSETQARWMARQVAIFVEAGISKEESAKIVAAFGKPLERKEIIISGNAQGPGGGGALMTSMALLGMHEGGDHGGHDHTKGHHHG